MCRVCFRNSGSRDTGRCRSPLPLVHSTSMMRNPGRQTSGRLAALLFCALAMNAACSGSTQSPTVGTISLAGLSGVWRVELAQLAGQGAVLAPSTATYTVTLSGSTVSARADCNACTASFTLVGDSLNVAPGLACTRALCPTQSFETQFTQILSGESTVVIQGDIVWLVSARGQLRLSRISTSTPSLS